MKMIIWACTVLLSNLIAGGEGNAINGICNRCVPGSNLCRKVSDAFIKPHLPLGYTTVTSIPQKVCHVYIREIRESSNFIAIKDSVGQVVLNGHWSMNYSGSYEILGSIVNYKRHDPSADNGESVYIEGPTKEPFELLIVNKNDIIGISYEYFIVVPDMRETLSDAGHEGLFDKKKSSQETFSLTKKPKKNKKREKKKKTFFWKLVTMETCTKECNGGFLHSRLICVKKNKREKHMPDRKCRHLPKPKLPIIRCNTVPCPVSWVPGDWSRCSASCNRGSQHRNLTCHQYVTRNSTEVVPDRKCHHLPKPILHQDCFIEACAHWKPEEWRECSVECGAGSQFRNVKCVSDTEDEVSPIKCMSETQPETERFCEVESCSRNEWFHNKWDLRWCTRDCQRSDKTRKVICPEGKCPQETKPNYREKCSEENGCQGIWFTGEWSECSESCGEGLQTRQVLCFVKIGSGLLPARDTSCLGDRPLASQPCEVVPCEQEWYTTPWSECPVSNCYNSSRSRSVFCLNWRGEVTDTCDESTQPARIGICTKDLCDEALRNLSDNIQSEEVKTVEKLSLPENCTDSHQTCHIAMKARLCVSRHYQQECCLSCYQHNAKVKIS